MNHKTVTNIEIVIGFTILFAISALGWLVIPSPEAGESLFWAKWLFLYSLPVLFGVIAIALRRYPSADLIKGSAFENDGLAVEQAYLQNTLEQTVIALPLVISFGMFAPLSLVKAVPIHATAFLVGRLLFFIGYKSSHAKRLRGFVVTNYANVALLIGCVYVIFVI